MMAECMFLPLALAASGQSLRPEQVEGTTPPWSLGFVQICRGRRQQNRPLFPPKAMQAVKPHAPAHQLMGNSALVGAALSMFGS